MSDPPFSTKLDDQLCFALYATSNAVTRFYRPHLKALGLTYPQYIVMLVLWEHDGITVNALGTRLGLDSGTLTPLLKRLEGAGLIHRKRDKGDERRVLISLSEQGTSLEERAADLPQTLGCAMGVPSDEIQVLIERLARMRLELQDNTNEQ